MMTGTISPKNRIAATAPVIATVIAFTTTFDHRRHMSLVLKHAWSANRVTAGQKGSVLGWPVRSSGMGNSPWSLINITMHDMQ